MLIFFNYLVIKLLLKSLREYFKVSIYYNFIFFIILVIKSLPINLKKKLKPAAHDAFFGASSCMGSCDGNIDGFGD
jgi:hypothetical protein